MSGTKREDGYEKKLLGENDLRKESRFGLRKKNFLTLMSAFAVLFILSCSAFAAGKIETEKKGSVTLAYTTQEGNMGGAEFKIYKIADLDENAKYTLKEEFTGSSVDLENIETSSDLKALATALLAYARVYDVEPEASGETDLNGSLEFDNLSVGMYLVAGGNVVVEDYNYSVVPVIVQIPSLDEADEWSYDLTASVKYEKELVEDLKDISVEKIWDDEDDENRPGSVTVALIRDGQIYEEITLSDENAWKYEWKNLENTYETGGKVNVYEWDIIEKNVPDGYSVKIENSNYTFKLTNTKSGEGVEPTPTPTEPTPTPDEPNEPTASPTPGTSSPSTPVPTKAAELPYTGQLNWPVPILSICGLMLVVIGVWVKRKNEE